MIRNEIERRNAEKDLAYLRTELEERADADRDDAAHEVAEALRIKAADVEAEIREYDNLKAGRVPVAYAQSLDGLGELLVKARISKGWSQGDLAKALDMEPQQIQRYERNDWQKASLWRLQEAAEALELDIALRAKLTEQEASAREADLSSEGGVADPEITPAFFAHREARKALEVASKALMPLLKSQAISNAYVTKTTHQELIRATRLRSKTLGERKFVSSHHRELEEAV